MIANRKSIKKRRLSNTEPIYIETLFESVQDGPRRGAFFPRVGADCDNVWPSRARYPSRDFQVFPLVNVPRNAMLRVGDSPALQG